MATYTYFAYGPDALDFSNGSVSLKDGYSPKDRVEIEVTDNDTYMYGDHRENEEGDDANQNATVRDIDGNTVDEGKIYAEEYLTLQGPDGQTIWLDVLEVDGEVVGYVPSSPLESGVDYANNGARNIDDGRQSGTTEDGYANGDTRLSHSAYQSSSVPCFCARTRVQTSRGLRAVEDLRAGEHVLTRDAGYQRVQWVGHVRVQLDGQNSAAFAPIRIAGAVGRDIALSPQHRVLVSGSALHLVYGMEEAFAPACAFADVGAGHQIWKDDVHYVHLLFERHHIVAVEGIWAESLLFAPQGLAALPTGMRDILRTRNGMPMAIARPCLSRREARALGDDLRPVQCHPTSDTFLLTA